MDKEILNYMKTNRKIMGQTDFDTFTESDEFNDMNEDSRKILFYINIFIMSTKDYKDFSEIIKDFKKIIIYIKGNEYLYNVDEIYEAIIINYLKKIQELLLKNYINENENKFIIELNTFTEEIKNICFPKNNPNMKLNINKYLERIKNQLDIIKEDINETNIKKYERYIDKLVEYINSLKNKIEINNGNNNSDNNKDIF